MGASTVQTGPTLSLEGLHSALPIIPEILSNRLHLSRNLGAKPAGTPEPEATSRRAFWGQLAAQTGSFQAEEEALLTREMETDVHRTQPMG